MQRDEARDDRVGEPNSEVSEQDAGTGTGRVPGIAGEASRVTARARPDFGTWGHKGKPSANANLCADNVCAVWKATVAHRSRRDRAHCSRTIGLPSPRRNPPTCGADQYRAEGDL